MATDTTVVSFRMPTGEYKALEQAATSAGESIAEHLRKVIALVSAGGIPVRIMPNKSQVANYTYTELPVPSSKASHTVMVEEYIRQ